MSRVTLRLHFTTGTPRPDVSPFTFDERRHIRSVSFEIDGPALLTWLDVEVDGLNLGGAPFPLSIGPAPLGSSDE